MNRSEERILGFRSSLDISKKKTILKRLVSPFNVQGQGVSEPGCEGFCVSYVRLVTREPGTSEKLAGGLRED